MGQIMKSGIPYGGGGGGSTYTAGDGIVIDNDEISTNNMPAEDMSEVITPLPSVMSRRFKYSTEEQIVGEWIDGKPVYQKTIQSTTPTVSSGVATKDISLGVSIDQCISCEGFYRTNNACVPIPTPYEELTGSVPAVTRIVVRHNSASSGKNVIRINTNASSASNCPCYITLQYTKTTD